MAVLSSGETRDVYRSSNSHMDPQRSRQALLSVWREACRHIEIAEASETIAGMLADFLPLERLFVRAFDAEHGDLLTVAVAPAEPDRPLAEERRRLEGEERRQTRRWCVRDRLLRRGKRLTGTLGLLLPHELENDLIAVPLSVRDEPLGALLLVAGRGREFDDDHAEMAAALREPFSVALDNDRRLHEVTRLREAAVAESRALLRRLGRTDVSDVVVGEHSGLRHVMERVNLVTSSDVPVLILGETGTGKEVVARAIHNRGPRREGPFIRVNCGAIPSELIDSQLFGHEKGSFTGADVAREGWFERAHGGTLFLDEIGELPLDAQVRFLRVLQDGFVERVGGARPTHVDVRIVAATHRDLATMVRERTFREDLWYRVAVFPVLLPPLRERKDDIEEFARHFAERAAVRFGLPHVPPTPADIHVLRSYDWPGNIRELGAVIDRAAILGNGASLEVAKALGIGDDHRLDAGRRSTPEPALAIASSPPADRSAFPSLDDAMRRHIESALALARGKIEGRRGAADLLKINPHTLRARMRRLKIDWSVYREM